MTTPAPLTARARNFAFDGEAPEWVELLPAGPAIQGQDGRAWTLPDPETLVAAFAQRHTPLVIDWEHASEHRAPQGLDAPAAGWIDRLEVRGGAIWGHVEWTPRAAGQIQAREYRYLSPVFSYQKTDDRIVQLLSAGLTNQPNLPLTALNRAEESMAISAPLLNALGLTDGASEAGVIDAIVKLKQDLLTASNRADAPPLERFVPRADYDAALARASNAESRLAALEAQQRDAKVAALLEKALAAGQIVPATQDYYRAMCQTEAGVAAFETFLAKAPAVIGAPSGLDGKAPPASTPEVEFAANAALRAEFADVEQYKAYKAAEAAGRVRIAKGTAE